ncbi:MAG: GGDEF domain-containing protein [Phycisphaeraceae bacterium]
MSHAGASLKSRDLLVIETDEHLAVELEAALASAARAVPLRKVPDYLMAIGEAGRRDVAAPLAVVCPLEAVNGQASAMVAALREVAPGVRLIAVASQGDEQSTRAARAAGFDACLGQPLDSSALLAAIDAPVKSDRSEVSTFSPPSSPHVEASVAQPFDIAVIDELINPHGQPRDAALAAITSRSGIEGIALAQAEDDIPPHHARAPVTCMNQTFGLLHAPPPAALESLQPWADWLARCLLLHRQQQDLWFMAMRDELTGAWNRRYFNRFLRMVLQRAEGDRSTVTLLLFDIDDFKHYNDAFSHAAGDEILRETVALMKAVVRDQDIVARIGGDEFAVIFWDAEAPRRANSRHPTDVVKIAERFRKAMQTHRFPKLESVEAPLTVSGGLASYPWDGKSPEELIAKADAMATQAKRDGKNAIRFGPT